MSEPQLRLPSLPRATWLWPPHDAACGISTHALFARPIPVTSGACGPCQKDQTESVGVCSSSCARSSRRPGPPSRRYASMDGALVSPNATRSLVWWQICLGDAQRCRHCSAVAGHVGLGTRCRAGAQHMPKARTGPARVTLKITPSANCRCRALRTKWHDLHLAAPWWPPSSCSSRSRPLEVSPCLLNCSTRR